MKKKYDNEDLYGNRKWLEDAIGFDVYVGIKSDSINRLKNDLIQEIIPVLPHDKRPKKKIKHSKDALRQILINVLIGYMEGVPVYYSRDKSNYCHHRRYGKLFFKADTLIPLIDAMVELGYLTHKKGVYYPKNGFGRQSRMFPTQKLIDLFEDAELNRPDIFSKEQPEEIIQLKNDNKRKLMGYTVTDEINRMRNSLTCYNSFINQQEIMVELNQDTEVSMRFLSSLPHFMTKGVLEILYLNCPLQVITDSPNSDTLLHPYLNRQSYSRPVISSYTLRDYTHTITQEITCKGLHSNPLTSTIHTCDIDLLLDNISTHTITQEISNITTLQDHNHSQCSDKSIQYTTIQYRNIHAYQYLKHYIHTITQEIREIEDKEKQREAFDTKKPLKDYGFSGLGFKIKYEYLHRVFNRSSFDLGGRFYGAFHLSLPSKIRKKCMKINGEPTVELDYSSLHIRMLYHMKGIDYREDPYGVLCDTPEERKMYKLLQLISINAKNERSAIWPIREAFHEAGIEYPRTKNPIKSLLEKFKSVHYPISEYLSSGIGLTLQNFDSAITENILIGFMSEGIPCLPVHDSYIVPAKYQSRLYEKMVEAYEKVMGFKPVIG